MQIVWDDKKAASNVTKHHGVTFDEAASCLLDPEAFVDEDPDAEGEARFILVGMSDQLRILTVCYALPDEETIRIISARKATRREETSYA